MENELIQQQRSNDPSIGYNQLPRSTKPVVVMRELGYRGYAFLALWAV
jgi:hypothetical protein